VIYVSQDFVGRNVGSFAEPFWPAVGWIGIDGKRIGRDWDWNRRFWNYGGGRDQHVGLTGGIADDARGGWRTLRAGSRRPDYHAFS
jgi:hypothetical protein